MCAHGSQGLCSSVSHSLMHFQAHNDHLLLFQRAGSAFCGRMMCCSPVLQLAAMGWTSLWKLYPLWIPMVSLPPCKRLLLPQCSTHTKHRSAWSQAQWVQVAVTGSPGKRKSWPAEKTTIPCCCPSRTGFGYEVRQCHVLCLPCSSCRHSPAATAAATLPFPQGSSFLKCHTSNRIRVIVGHRKFQGTSLNLDNEGNVSLPSHLIGSLEKQAFCNRK